VYVGDTISGTIEIVDTQTKTDVWGLLSMDVTLSNQDDETVLFEKHKMLISRIIDI
jgi:acyl dehydratase